MTDSADNGSPGFSERYANEESLPCARCSAKGFFHWPSLADHTPIASAEPTYPSAVLDHMASRTDDPAALSEIERRRTRPIASAERKPE